ncbi:D-glycero-beta-D-manno-heptose 1-phosphate adenylyltransferase [Parafrankia elaeagni]|uniref:D-glycero-beta-D-manno-heptose 1-phosphate adenylyltransferase n=1 Tax=Parafrankia elaeagni TaxID=222534 RepID=UPI000370702E|nr:D-glycero-beta-D-manno-heptose 1-phosphate adenylyltransferase [Parafrankia elaeagni]
MNAVSALPATRDPFARRDALDALASLDALDLLVVGDVMLDSWVWGPPRGLSREGPVPVVAVAGRSEAPGGAGNAAVAAAGLGARVRLVATVGDDQDGARLRELLNDAGVDTAAVLDDHGRRTVHKQRICSGEHLHLRIDSGDEAPPGRAAGAGISSRLFDAAARAPGLVSSSAAVLACDYGTGLFSPDLVRRLGSAARSAGRPLVVDAHEPRRWAPARPDIVTPNAAETSSLLPPDAAGPFLADRPRTVAAHAEAILNATGARVVVVTLDRDGLVVLDGEHLPLHLPAEPAPDGHTAGAGDTLAATLATAVGGGTALEPAVTLAAAAASVVVRRPGTSVCTAADLRACLGPKPPGAIGLPALAEQVHTERRRGSRIVLTNGCFDVLHRGHIAYLSAARALGDILIVGVNSDAGVRRLKGPERPVNALEDRLAVLTALTDIDHLVVFDEDTATGLITALRPDVYVKGGDYTEAMLPEAALVRAQGGQVRFVDYVPDHSTSGLLERIRGGRPPALTRRRP